jgi:gluconolactonase
MKRRDFIAGTAGAGVAAFALTHPGFAQQRYEPALSGLREGVDTGTMPGQAVESSPRYPETTLVHALDPRFYKYMVGNTYVQRLWTGSMWAEGPVYFGDLKVLVFSDIPNNRLLRYDEVTGQISVLRQPSSYANGNTRDRQGRLLSCLQDERCVIRTEHDGTLTKLAAEFDGKKLNGPNDIVVRSDDSIWFTDPGYGIGSYWESTHQTNAELPRTVYRFDPKSGKIDVVSKDQVRPNGLAFSPDEKKLYICDTGITDGPDKPSNIMAYDVSDDNRLTNAKVFFDLKKEVPQISAMVEKHLHEHGLSAAADASHLAARPRPAARRAARRKMQRRLKNQRGRRLASSNMASPMASGSTRTATFGLAPAGPARRSTASPSSAPTGRPSAEFSCRKWSPTSPSVAKRRTGSIWQAARRSTPFISTSQER